MKTYFAKDSKTAEDFLVLDNYEFGTHTIKNSECNCACGQSNCIVLINDSTSLIELRVIICEGCYNNAPLDERLVPCSRGWNTVTGDYELDRIKDIDACPQSFQYTHFFQTDKIALAAVQACGLNLMHVINKTEEICKAAYQQDKNASQYFPKGFKIEE